VATNIAPDELSKREVISDPYPIYRRVRDSSPFKYIDLPAGMFPGIEGPLRSWALMKYSDVYGALRDYEIFSSARPLVAKAAAPLPMIFDDPPRHTRFRRLVNKAFTVRRVEALTPWITSVAHELLDQIGADEFDIVQHYTVPLPVKVIARLLGIPGSDYEIFKRWSDAFLSLTSMESTERMRNIQEMASYFGKIAATRRSHGAEDLITALVEAEIEGEKLEEWEILGFCILLLIAGNETTTNLLGNILNLLANRPELWQQLRSNPALVEAVIEESLRYESPIQRISRMTTRDVKVSGACISKGDRVTLYFGAANRDPDVPES
jgi:cytochrome P450